MCAAGPADEDGLAPELRQGLLWDECRKFVAGGWVVDTNGYSTAFRITLKVHSYSYLSAVTYFAVHQGCGRLNPRQHTLVCDVGVMITGCC